MRLEMRRAPATDDSLFVVLDSPSAGLRQKDHDAERADGSMARCSLRKDEDSPKRPRRTARREGRCPEGVTNWVRQKGTERAARCAEDEAEDGTQKILLTIGRVPLYSHTLFQQGPRRGNTALVIASRRSDRNKLATLVKGGNRIART